MLNFVGDWFLAWQTLVSGLIALAGALLTVRALRRQVNDDRTRKSRAARALLPAALASVDDYIVSCIRWLREARGVARSAEHRPHVIFEIVLDPLPQFDPGTAAVLRDCVEHVDEMPAKRLAGLMSDIQVHSSRLAGLDDYLRRYQRLDVKQVGLDKNIDGFIASAVAVAAEAQSFFNFARLETNESPPPSSFETVSAAFHACGLDSANDVGPWNVITNRFPPQILSS